MSVRLLDNPLAGTQCPDDLESFFWVVIYLCLKHLRHDMDTAKLQQLIYKIFEAVEDDGLGQHIGGDAKAVILGGGMLHTNIRSIADNAPMTRWLHAILVLFRDRYRAMKDNSEMEDPLFENGHEQLRKLWVDAIESLDWPCFDDWVLNENLTKTKSQSSSSLSATAKGMPGFDKYRALNDEDDEDAERSPDPINAFPQHSLPDITKRSRNSHSPDASQPDQPPLTKKLKTQDLTTKRKPWK